ncbi:glycosyl hydrolase 115 family protein [Blautia sp. OF09-25XD]|uniref:glycosyl hydrolase 115 family protein n=1 Tax=Blautia sp. OF09-25XD TaxID=2292981 RepID=UPI000E5D21F2|nr:glycosyl hydrolase 115 family protein [Blautia sp. OF09-25XD]RHV93941.1 alpha-glucuronidase [Blautia sp. OF09-25XD]
MRICLEQSAFPGVIRVTEKVAHDVELVSGKKPQILVEKEIPETLESSGEDWTIIAATKGKSSFLKKLEEAGSAELKELEQKRECYAWIFPEIKNRTKSNLLVIAGSDKRGTIYGLFHLSEMLGVSPFVDWCGLMPPKQEKIELREDMACISKEPSVRYRGFFINDEWPAFGNWCNHNFGGFNAKAYDHVFELLLRLKGNYLWPAMWSARFADDGPDLLNAELADEYGIIMGMSHHEPCLRQGEEYKYLRGKNSVYGDAWNFRTNREGITKFWEDGLKRSGKFENVITVGMRGEADTAIMGKNATLEDNIQLLRDVLKTQKKLIQEHVNPDLTKVPRMIALYKEVEEFFYGDEKTKGLMGAEELEDVILMLCDDNYGNLRTLPTEEMRKHAGGYGMYYHLDYHGWPVSYEWINSSYLPKIWEQMSMAYDFGVRELWMVNVGDIATQEFPLSFFLDMAYDFDRWGSRALNCTQEYTRKWVRQQFGSVEEETQDTIADILEQYTKIIHRRRPEALNPETYHPVQEKESSRIFEEAEQLLKKLQDVYETIEKTNPQNLSAFIALVYYPAFGTMNLVKMQILAGWNHYYANLGAVCANDYVDEVERCMEQDRKAVEMYHQMDQGRWYGMGMSQHIGFTHWNEDECRNPVVMRVIPLKKRSILVAADGTAQHAEGSPWLDNTMKLKDFLNPDCTRASVTLYSRSDLKAEYKVLKKPGWLSVEPMEGWLDGVSQKKVRLNLTLIKQRLPETNQDTIQDSLEIATPEGKCEITVPVYTGNLQDKKNVFVDTMGYLSIEAAHYVNSVPGNYKDRQVKFENLQGYGKTNSAMKAFPSDACTVPGQDAPYLEYQFVLEESGTYEAEFYMQPSNPVTRENQLLYAVRINEEMTETVNAVEKDYQVGDQAEKWAEGVLSQIRRQTVSIKCRAGFNTLRVYHVTPGFVLEKIVIYPMGEKPEESYLGPAETYHGRQEEK